ncbi:[histone H3]-lysine27 N-trimethyltransferase EZH2 [Enteropsectra breve]|nr:[histone H3]-lysine27 N-trimethyltransferase EZH2 [Enteropsectra breve]
MYRKGWDEDDSQKYRRVFSAEKDANDASSSAAPKKDEIEIIENKGYNRPSYSQWIKKRNHGAYNTREHGQYDRNNKSHDQSDKYYDRYYDRDDRYHDKYYDRDDRHHDRYYDRDDRNYDRYSRQYNKTENKHTNRDSYRQDRGYYTNNYRTYQEATNKTISKNNAVSTNSADSTNSAVPTNTTMRESSDQRRISLTAEDNVRNLQAKIMSPHKNNISISNKISSDNTSKINSNKTDMISSTDYKNYILSGDIKQPDSLLPARCSKIPSVKTAFLTKEQMHKNAEKIYKTIVEELKRTNADKIIKTTSGDKTASFTVYKGITTLPSICPEPKTNFLTLTGFNLYTKDEPILKYVPSIPDDSVPITWFDGTTIGDEPLKPENVVDNIFMDCCSFGISDKESFIRRTFNRETLLRPGPIAKMDETFCAVCCLFSCGIHRTNTVGIIKYNEPDSCVCSDETRALARNAVTNNIPSEIKNARLSSCAINKILQIKYNCAFRCDVKHIYPVKKIENGKKEVLYKEFYEPCVHEGPCNIKTCSCVKNKVACELACRCACCNNLKFCKCAICGDKCSCSGNNRECSELCASDCVDHRPIFARAEKDIKVFASHKHGYGTFSNCFIEKGAFVVEYTGEVISDKEAERRGNFYEMNRCSYLFNLVAQRDDCLFSADAFALGNKSRYFNHSEKFANLKAEIIVADGPLRIVFFSLREIYKGEELLFDYHFSDEHKVKHGIID